MNDEMFSKLDDVLIIREGERHEKLFEHLKELKKYFDDKDIFEMLIAHNNNFCMPPLPHDEIVSIASKQF